MTEQLKTVLFVLPGYSGYN